MADWRAHSRLFLAASRIYEVFPLTCNEYGAKMRIIALAAETALVRSDAMRFFKALPKGLATFSLEVASEKTQVFRFSRFHPRKRRRTAFLGFELFWCFASGVKGV